MQQSIQQREVSPSCRPCTCSCSCSCSPLPPSFLFTLYPEPHLCVSSLLTNEGSSTSTEIVTGTSPCLPNQCHFTFTESAQVFSRASNSLCRRRRQQIDCDSIHRFKVANSTSSARQPVHVSSNIK